MDETNTSRKKLIMIPYAYQPNTNTGANIKNINRQMDIYLKNCCVACASARKHNDSDTDVALVTNIEPPSCYCEVLAKYDIKIISVPFDRFCFDSQYTWALAFYKLCALDHVVEDYSYEYYAYLDSDTFSQFGFDNIWDECKSRILLYDTLDGLQVEHYRHFLSEIQLFSSEIKGSKPTQYGGEFFAANRFNAQCFIRKCHDIYNIMLQRGISTTHGDEYITSIAASMMPDKIKNAGAYIFRFETGSFRLISTCYKFNPIVVIHVPAEKEIGMIKIYDRYVSHGKIPCNSTAHKLLHLTTPSYKTRLRVGLTNIKKLLHLR